MNTKKKSRMKISTQIKPEKGVLYLLDENVEEFCKRYNLKVKKINCETCKKELEMNIPSYCDGHACLEAPICKCGTKANKIVFQPVTKERKKFWNRIEGEIFF